MMVGAATVFVVTDRAKSTEHYREVLGFPRLTGRGMRRFEFGSCLLTADYVAKVGCDGSGRYAFR
jgi:hypothetical protein